MAKSREQRLRYKAKKAARDKAMIGALRSTGAACSNCTMFDPKRKSFGGRSRCDMHSDFNGDCYVHPGDICTKYNDARVCPRCGARLPFHTVECHVVADDPNAAALREWQSNSATIRAEAAKMGVY